MILTQLPDLPPRPETDANAAFRRNFYARWGRENAVICGSALRAEYAVLAQTLSIKMTLGGRERYLLPQREVVVDDDNLLVLNQGARYGSVLQATTTPAWSFAVFFRPGLQGEVAAQQARPLAAALDTPLAAPRSVQFSEHLRAHQGSLSQGLRQLATRIRAGERDEAWLEEQLQALLLQMLSEERAAASHAAPRALLRAELQRRLRLAADCMESAYAEALTLDALAAVACLSRFHFVRAFGQAYGLSPHAYLTRKRAVVAARWLQAGDGDRDWVAQQCGLGSRWTLQRALARYAPHALASRNFCTQEAAGGR